jgi:hypothetical protein
VRISVAGSLGLGLGLQGWRWGDGKMTDRWMRARRGSGGCGFAGGASRCKGMLMLSWDLRRIWVSWLPTGR